VRLWELPTFAERGELSAVHDARALTAGSAAGLLVSGDKHGAVKVCHLCVVAAAVEARIRWACRPSARGLLSRYPSQCAACRQLAVLLHTQHAAR